MADVVQQRTVMCVIFCFLLVTCTNANFSAFGGIFPLWRHYPAFLVAMYIFLLFTTCAGTLYHREWLDSYNQGGICWRDRGNVSWSLDFWSPPHWSWFKRPWVGCIWSPLTRIRLRDGYHMTAIRAWHSMHCYCLKWWTWGKGC